MFLNLLIVLLNRSEVVRGRHNDGAESPVSNITDGLAQCREVLRGETTCGAVHVDPERLNMQVDLLGVDVRVGGGSGSHFLLAAHVREEPLSQGLDLCGSARASRGQALELHGDLGALGDSSPLIARFDQRYDVRHVRDDRLGVDNAIREAIEAVHVDKLLEEASNELLCGLCFPFPIAIRLLHVEEIIFTWNLANGDLVCTGIVELGHLLADYNCGCECGSDERFHFDKQFF